jgi:predicted dehydrogenase
MSSQPKSTLPRVALIGVSGYGGTYYALLRELHSLGEIQLTAVAMIEPEKEKAIVAELGKIGCEVFSDFHEMLKRHSGRIELCAIPTGIPWHAPMTLAALGAGAHVLVEKPLAATLEEVERIHAAEVRHGRQVMVGFQYHYSVENMDLKRALLGSVIGSVQKIRVIGLWPRGAEYYSRTDWAGRIRSNQGWVLDSPISNAFAHHLSLALFFAGAQPDRSAAPVRMEAELYRAQQIENFDTAALRIETDTGVDIRLYASHSCSSTLDPEILIDGSKGSVSWMHNRSYRIAPAGAEPRFVALCDEHAARFRMFRSVLRRLRDPGEFVCGTAIAREHTRCIQAAQCAGSAHDVPKDWVENNGKPGLRSKTWIKGIEETMRRAFDRAISLGEAGCPWAQPAMRILVADSDREGITDKSPSRAT